MLVSQILKRMLLTCSGVSSQDTLILAALRTVSKNRRFQKVVDIGLYRDRIVFGEVLLVLTIRALLRIRLLDLFGGVLAIHRAQLLVMVVAKHDLLVN